MAKNSGTAAAPRERKPKAEKKFPVKLQDGRERAKLKIGSRTISTFGAKSRLKMPKVAVKEKESENG
jgi:hypothetical protein